MCDVVWVDSQRRNFAGPAAVKMKGTETFKVKKESLCKIFYLFGVHILIVFCAVDKVGLQLISVSDSDVL
jgi:hypothetical protein